MKKAMEEYDIQEWIDANYPDWKIILHDAQMANKGAHAHEINKNIGNLRYTTDKIQKDRTTVTWSDFNSAARAAQILAHKLYLLSKGR